MIAMPFVLWTMSPLIQSFAFAPISIVAASPPPTMPVLSPTPPSNVLLPATLTTSPDPANSSVSIWSGLAKLAG